MLPMSERLLPNPEVVDTRIGDELALLHLETKTYFSLNPTGARIWSGIKSGDSLGAICTALQQEYEVDAERAARSVAELAEDLLRQRLVHRECPGD